MQLSAQFYIAIGAILLIALAADWIGKNSFLPRVTLLMIFGLIIGQHGLGLIPDVVTDQFEFIATIALLMVGFLIGGKLSDSSMTAELGKTFYICSFTVMITFGLVTAGLLVFNINFEIALLLGCIATATAPAATIDVITEANTEGTFPNLLTAIVALDDAMGLILFSITIAILGATAGNGEPLAPLLSAIQEVGGAVILGLIIGLPAALLTGRLRQGQPMLIEALALVFLCGGLAIWLEVSYLITSIVMGLVIGKLARHHDYPFHAIEGVEWVFLVIFFTLAGATLSFGTLGEIGVLGIAYIALRSFGKVAGGWVGALVGRSDPVTRRWIGSAMLPQAGVAVGMALAASLIFPQHRQVLLPVVIGSTVIFELFGPVLTRHALKRVENARR